MVPFQHILCAVRGGPESRITVTLAIDLALEYHARLTFVHVVDAEFLGYATIGPLSVVYQELTEMSSFAMHILVDRAERRGVNTVDFRILEGDIRRQLLHIAVQTHAEILVIGKPVRSPGSNVFKSAQLNSFAKTLGEQGHLKIMVAE